MTAKPVTPEPAATLSIKEGVLIQGDGLLVDSSKMIPPGHVIVPRVIVAHYAVTSSLSATVAAQAQSGYRAHLSIDGYVDNDRDGEPDNQEEDIDVKQVTSGNRKMVVSQLVNFKCRGAHAGESIFAGEHGVNNFSIGIEIANPGPLVEKNGKLYTVYGKKWPKKDALPAVHSFKFAPGAWKHWAKYTQEEVEAFIKIARLLVSEYDTITSIVGHDEISPGRKFDPGPAFPMEEIRRAVFG